jgi:hypothetical protein
MTIHSAPSLGKEVKPSAPCHDIVRQVKGPLEVWATSWGKFISFSSSSCFTIRWLLVELPESCSGRIRNFPFDIFPPWFSMLMYHQGDEQQVRWWPRFGHLVSPHRHHVSDINSMGSACSTYEETINAYRISVGNRKGRNLVRDLGVGGKIILKLILRTCGCRVWFGFFWYGIGFSGGFCEQGNEPLDPVKSWEFYYLLTGYQFHKKDSAVWRYFLMALCKCVLFVRKEKVVRNWDFDGIIICRPVYYRPACLQLGERETVLGIGYDWF